mmetsp:Transcript_95751/g.214497  ORF Transcript_95751/g.214497 Transcript_95751/m.214497 type:complete len:375 (-) Transcript_95751:84-1208(-)
MPACALSTVAPSLRRRPCPRARRRCSVAVLGICPRRLPVQGVRLGSGVGVLAVDLDGLIALPSDEAACALVELQVEDPVLRTHAAGLGYALQALVLVAAAPVPKVEVAVVGATDEDGRALLRLFDGASVDDGPMAGDVALELAARALPHLVVVGGAGGKGVLRGVDAQGPHALLVVRQGHRALAGGQVPESDRAVHRAADELRLCRLRGQGAGGAGVAREDEDTRLGSHVPDAHGRVPAPSRQDVQRRVQGYGVDATEVAVVVPDHHVLLQVPALDLAVLGDAEQVGVPVGDGEPPHRVDVAGKGDLQGTAGEVPDLDQPVVARGGEPLVRRVHRHTAHPTLVPREHSHELPGRVPDGLRDVRLRARRPDLHCF